MRLIKRSWWKTTEVEIDIDEIKILMIGGTAYRPIRDFLLKFMGYKMKPRLVTEQGAESQPQRPMHPDEPQQFQVQKQEASKPRAPEPQFRI